MRKKRTIRGIPPRHKILFRKSHKGKDVKIYVKPYEFDEDITVSVSKSYVVWADGAIVLKTDDLEKAEKLYTDKCKAHYDDVHGRFVVGKHILDDGVVKTIGEET